MLRLQIVSTGEFLVLANDNVLTVELLSTMFNNQDSFLGSFTYDGSMPLEPNRHLLRNAHLINTGVELRTFDVIMYVGRLFYKQVQLNFTIDGDTVKYNLFIDTGILARRLKVMKLNEIQNTLFNGQMFFNSRQELNTYINSTITAPPATQPMVFFPYKNDGAYNEISFLDQPNYPNIQFPIGEIFNPWQLVDGVGSFTFNPDNGKNAQTFTPAFYLVYILKRICDYFGCAPTGKWLQDENSKRITVQSNIPIQNGTMIQDFAFFMPDMLVADFLKLVRQEFGLLIDFDLTRKIALIESFENLESEEATFNLTGKQLVGFRETGTTLKSYLITRVADDKDSAYTDQEKAALPAIPIGDQTGIYEVETIPLASAATQMITGIRPGSTGTWRIPYIKQPIFGEVPFQQISSVDYKDRGAFKVRFLFWHGMVPDSLTDRYPYGSSDNLDRQGNALSNYTLSLASGNAYLAVKRFINFIRNTRPFEVSFYCTPTEFARINPKTTFTVKDRNLATVKCLLDSATADIGAEGEIFAKATLYPFIRPNTLPVLLPVEIPGTDPQPPGPDTIYVRLVKYNEQKYHYTSPPPAFDMTIANLRLEFFSDAAGTIPRVVTALEVVIERRTVTNNQPYVSNNFSKVCNGTFTELLYQETIYNSRGGTVVYNSFHIVAKPEYVKIGDDITGGL